MTQTEMCDICNLAVTDGDDGLLCEKCLIWKHRGCLSMTQKTYQKLSRSKEAWICENCITNKKSTKTCTNMDLMKKLEEMDEKYNALFQKYTEQLKINEELKKEIIDIKKDLNRREQRELSNNLIIHGVPYKTNEKVDEIIKNIGGLLDVSLNNQSFTAVRLGKENQKTNLIKVTFQDENTKQKIIKSPKRRQLNTSKLGLNIDKPIFLNHDLTKQNQELFKKANDFKKENGFKFLWISKGSILLRKEENSKIMAIEKEDDLKN